MTPDFDAVVVGAGVVGLAVARELSRSGQSVLVLEKAASAGTETSSRNSEVIHAGIYYPAGTLKAKLCVEGRHLLYDYCATHRVDAKRIGKLIVASSSEEEAKLRSIMELAELNGVTDLQWLTSSEVHELEPEVVCTKALFSPSTGIVDTNGYMLALQGEAEAHGTSFAFNTMFSDATRRDGVFIITATGESGESTVVSSNAVFNCAGHGAHDVATSITGYDPKFLPPRYFARGHYCSVSGRSPFTHLVYPVPVPGALGIHATLDMGGAVRFGPDIQWIESLDYSMPDGLPGKFAAAISAYWPGVRDRELTPTYCGIRPKVHGSNQSFSDFVIQGQVFHEVSNLVNIFGIESPGLTSSLALASYVRKQLVS